LSEKLINTKKHTNQS